MSDNGLTDDRQPTTTTDMKRIFLIPLMAVLVCAGACKSVSSFSTLEYYDSAGNLVAVQESKSKTSGLFVKASAVQIGGAATNSVTLTNGMTYASGKQFGADAVASEASAEAMKAFGESVGGAIGEALSKAAK